MPLNFIAMTLYPFGDDAANIPYCGNPFNFPRRLFSLSTIFIYWRWLGYMRPLFLMSSPLLSRICFDGGKLIS